MATPVTPGGNAKHCDGCRDPVNCEVVNDPCSVCKKQFNEVTGKPVILDGKKFHRSCFNCKSCGKRLQPGWMIVHPAGLFCNDTCMQIALKMAGRMPYEPSRNDAKAFIFDYCIICTLPVDEDCLETWIICAGSKIHQQCLKCEICATPPPTEGEIIVCAGRIFCNDACIRRSSEKTVKVNYQPTTPVRLTDATMEDGSVQCGVCSKSINDKPISCGEKQFHQSCFKCRQCDQRLEPGSLLMLPDGGLFCDNTYFTYADPCIRSFGARAMQVSYKPGSNNDNNNFIVSNNCLVCKTPINKELLETCVNCSGSIIHQECFKCKACDATPPPEGEIMALSTWFFCDDDCIRSFGEKVMEGDYKPTAPARAADATKETEDETRSESEEEMFHPMEAAASPAIAAEERSSRKKPPK